MDQRWLQVIEDLIADAERTSDGVERARLLCRTAEIYEHQLADPGNALVALQAAFRDDPGSGQVVQELERIARTQGKWLDVITSTAEVVESVTDQRQAADLWVQIAYWWDSGLGRADEGVRAATRALALDGTHGGALALLEDVFRRQRAWDALVDVLERRARSPYRDATKIAEAYATVLNQDPQHAGALAGLAQIYEDTEQWEQAVAVLRQLTELAPPDGRVKLHYRAGQILRERLRDPRAAEEQLTHALAASPEQVHLPSMRMLGEIYRERGDDLKAAQLSLRLAELVPEAAEKLRLTYEAARLYDERLEDRAKAAELYAATLALDPEHDDATERLARITFDRGDWAALEPLARRQIERATGRPAAERAGACYRHARAAQELGDEDTAAQSYQRALDIDAAYAPALRDFAALAYRREDWATAARLLEALLAASPDGLGRDERIDALHRLGIARRRLGQQAQALASFEQALALDPRHAPTLAALADAHAADGAFETSVKHKQALLAVTTDADAKITLLREIAEIHRDKLKDEQKAVAALLAALELRPDDRQLLHDALDLLTATRQWKQAVQLLTRLAALEDEGARQVRARYLVAAANILNHELRSYDDALTLYEDALDLEPTDLKTFERVDKIVTAARDWKTQERCYKRQIKRMGAPDAETKTAHLALWEGLGEVYRSRLKDHPAAIAAFEVCAGLDPEATRYREILAELYRLGGPATLESAIAEYRRLLRTAREPRDLVPHLRVLGRIFVEGRNLDAAWCASQALVMLAAANPEERQLYEQLRPRGLVRAQSRLTEELWQRCIYHPDEDRLVSQIMAVISQSVAFPRSREHKDWGLKRKLRRDVASDKTLVSQVLYYGSQILGVPLPEIYFAPETPGEIDLANARAGALLVPSFVIGAELLQRRPDPEVAFVAARGLAMFRPDHLIRWPTVIPTIPELKAVFLAALRLVNLPLPVDPETQPAVEKYTTFLHKVLPATSVEQLAIAVERFVSTKPALDLARWSRGVFLSCTRAGFLLANDLEVASRLGQRGAGVGNAVEPHEVLIDLAAWSVSDEYLGLRAQLGLALK